MLIEMMQERWINVIHTTILKWVLEYSLIIDEEIRKGLNNLDKTQQKLNFQLGGERLENGSDDSVLFGRITSAQDKIRTFTGIKTLV